MQKSIRNYLSKTTEAAPLAAFRIFFGLLMCLSIIRFWYYGWIEKMYIEPAFHFKYWGFAWVQVPPNTVLYALFILCGLSAILVALGLWYRVAIVAFFLTFTYIELMDKTTYLNHYYFISVLSFLLIFLPAHRYFSLDAKRNPKLAVQRIPAYNIHAIMLLLAIVYIYAGVAKLHSDWILHALPLKIWLPSKYGIPLLGDLMQQSWVHYLFSWGGAIYDLTIVFFLLYRPTRVPAFIMVVLFHVMTRVLFPIGMFPYIMIGSTLIFFSANFHHKLLTLLSRIFRINKAYFDNEKILHEFPSKGEIVAARKVTRAYLPLWRGLGGGSHSNLFTKIKITILSSFLIIQLLLPWRYLCYPGNVFWTEQGYRYAWRVMLMEKAGYANFKIVEGATGKRLYVNNGSFLTPFQEKQMATQPDFILEYAHFLGETYTKYGYEDVEVYVESYVALNGRSSRPFIDPDINLLELRDTWQHKDWILCHSDIPVR